MTRVHQMSRGHLGPPATARQLGIDVLLQQPQRGPSFGSIACQKRGVMVILEHKLPGRRAVESGSSVHGYPSPLQYHEDMHKA
jgi:hypothetical protein